MKKRLVSNRNGARIEAVLRVNFMRAINNNPAVKKVNTKAVAKGIW